MTLAIIGMLELIAILGRDRRFFVLAGFGLMFFGFTYWSTSEVFSIILVVAGIINMSIK